MPFYGNYASRHPLAPSVQSSIIDSTATLGGNAALLNLAGASVPGVVRFTGSGDSIQLGSLLLAGNSVVTIAGSLQGTNPATDPGAFSLDNAVVLLRAQIGGITQTVDRFYWRPGEQTLYETYRLSGETVTVSVTAGAGQGIAAFTLTLHAISV